MFSSTWRISTSTTMIECGCISSEQCEFIEKDFQFTAPLTLFEYQTLYTAPDMNGGKVFSHYVLEGDIVGLQKWKISLVPGFSGIYGILKYNW